MTPDAAVREDAGLLTARFLRAVRDRAGEDTVAAAAEIMIYGAVGSARLLSAPRSQRMTPLTHPGGFQNRFEAT